MVKPLAFNEEKFQELILYLSESFQDEVFFGATKLHKLLFFCDFLAFERLEHPITGAEYLAREYGPWASRFGSFQERMIEDGCIAVERRKYQQRIISLRQSNLNIFDKEELDIINYVIRALKNATAEDVTALTHQMPGWQKARAEGLLKGDYVEISYGTDSVSAALQAAELSKDSRYVASTVAGFRDLDEGRYSSLEDVKRRLSGV